MEKFNKINLSHVGLQITDNDLQNFYIECLGGTIVEKKELKRERAFDIFYISKNTNVYYVLLNNLLLELFVHQCDMQNTFTHLCIKCENYEAIKNQCKKYHYSMIEDNNKFFIKDNNNNTFEILKQ